MTDVVRVDNDGAVAIMTLNRPESLNAMNGEVLNTMASTCARLAEDPAVRCVVVTGAGRAFSAGGDVKGMAESNDAGSRSAAPPPNALITGASALRAQEEASRLLYEMPKPTIAAINGVAAGAGLSIALACDIRIAGSAARFTTAFSKIGFSGDFGGTWLLQRLVGPSKAKELYFLSDIFLADEALRLGIVSKVVPQEELMEATMALARRLASGPTAAYGLIKDNFTYGATSTFGDALTHEAENMMASGRTEDHRAATRAFVEKREPVFTGR